MPDRISTRALRSTTRVLLPSAYDCAYPERKPPMGRYQARPPGHLFLFHAVQEQYIYKRGVQGQHLDFGHLHVDNLRLEARACHLGEVKEETTEQRPPSVATKLDC